LSTIEERCTRICYTNCRKKHVFDVHNNNFNVYLNGIESYLEVIDGDNLHVGM